MLGLIWIYRNKDEINLCNFT